jgi:hypothetical protein
MCNSRTSLGDAESALAHIDQYGSRPENAAWLSPRKRNSSKRSIDGVTFVEADPVRRGFLLTFSRSLVDLTEGERYLFGQDHPPVGVTIELLEANRVHLEPTLDSLQTMPEDVARRISEAGILTAE